MLSYSFPQKLGAAGQFAANSTTNNSQEDEIKIPRHALLRVLQGVAVATKSSPESITPISDVISHQKRPVDSRPPLGQHDTHPAQSRNNSLTMSQWQDLLLQHLTSERSRQLAILTTTVAYLRQHSHERQHSPIPPDKMSQIWTLFHSILTHPTLNPPLCHPVRSAQGFLSVALCSLISSSGNIDELFRFHVWLPDGQRGNSSFPIHSHQPFAQSWILAGEGTDLLYDVRPALDASTATHAKYIPAWSDGKTLSSTYKTHQTISVIANTGELVCAAPSHSTAHSRDMTYTVPSAQFHTSVIPDNALHSTFFFFDSSRGFEKDASVLGPVHGESFAQHRDPAGITAAALARIVHAARRWEIAREKCALCVRSGDYDAARRSCREAMRVCDECDELVNREECTVRTRAEMDEVERLICGTKGGTREAWRNVDEVKGVAVGIAGT